MKLPSSGLICSLFSTPRSESPHRKADHRSCGSSGILPTIPARADRDAPARSSRAARRRTRGRQVLGQTWIVL